MTRRTTAMTTLLLAAAGVSACGANGGVGGGGSGPVFVGGPTVELRLVFVISDPTQKSFIRFTGQTTGEQFTLIAFTEVPSLQTFHLGTKPDTYQLDAYAWSGGPGPRPEEVLGGALGPLRFTQQITVDTGPKQLLILWSDGDKQHIDHLTRGPAANPRTENVLNISDTGQPVDVYLSTGGGPRVLKTTLARGERAEIELQLNERLYFAATAAEDLPLKWVWGGLSDDPVPLVWLPRMAATNWFTRPDDRW